MWVSIQTHIEKSVSYQILGRSFFSGMCRCVVLNLHNGWTKDLLNFLTGSFFLTTILYNIGSGLISSHYLLFNLCLCHTLKPFTLCRQKASWNLTSHFSLDTHVESFFTAEWGAGTMLRRPKQPGCSFIRRSSYCPWVTVSSCSRQARKDGCEQGDAHIVKVSFECFITERWCLTGGWPGMSALLQLSLQMVR